MHMFDARCMSELVGMSVRASTYICVCMRLYACRYKRFANSFRVSVPSPLLLIMKVHEAVCVKYGFGYS